MTPLALLREDIRTVMRRDPAVTSWWEAILYPHLTAIWGHRLAHSLYRRSWTASARLVSLVARVLSGGADIHPGARLGRRLFMDHPTGVVIGSTAVLGDDVVLFQDVTLGAKNGLIDRDFSPDHRRHPVLGDGVVVGAKASVLGAVVVGDRAHIGAHALVLHDVPPGARVRAAEALCGEVYRTGSSGGPEDALPGPRLIPDGVVRLNGSTAMTVAVEEGPGAP